MKFECGRGRRENFEIVGSGCAGCEVGEAEEGGVMRRVEEGGRDVGASMV